MGRIKIPQENKKKNIALYIDAELYKKFLQLDIKNKSKFFNWLLKEHLNMIEKGDTE